MTFQHKKFRKGQTRCQYSMPDRGQGMIERVRAGASENFQPRMADRSPPCQPGGSSAGGHRRESRRRSPGKQHTGRRQYTAPSAMLVGGQQTGGATVGETQRADGSAGLRAQGRQLWRQFPTLPRAHHSNSLKTEFMRAFHSNKNPKASGNEADRFWARPLRR